MKIINKSKGVIDLHCNSRLHEVRVYEGSLDEHGKTVLGKLKYTVSPAELQVRADEFPAKMKQSLERSHRLIGLQKDKPAKVCIICKKSYIPYSNSQAICSKECRNKRSRNLKRVSAAKKQDVDISKLKNMQED
jgi:predicted nucleic acid-binding Zn ribbon protein